MGCMRMGDEAGILPGGAYLGSGGGEGGAIGALLDAACLDGYRKYIGCYGKFLCP